MRKIVVGDETAKKFHVAKSIIERHGFEELRGKLPKPPARAALGWRSKDKYWLQAFDALALAIAAMEGSTLERTHMPA